MEKKAKYLVPDDVIDLGNMYTIKVKSIMTLNDGTIQALVEHVPEEVEFWNGASTHTKMYHPDDILKITDRHGNEGIEWKGRRKKTNI